MNHFLFYSQPTIGGFEKGRPYVYFSHVLTKKKFRYYSGVAFGMRSARGLNQQELDLYFRSLAQAITLKLTTGWNPEELFYKAKKIEKANKPLRSYSNLLCDYIDKADYGVKHKYTLKWYWVELVKQFAEMGIDDIEDSDIQTHQWSIVYSHPSSAKLT